jgi:hypothetical protein
MAPRAAALFALLLVGCFPPGEGQDPPRGKVYFPVGLAVDHDQRFLFVVNSDFDLQYNAGTVQSWDLEQLRARVPRYCESDADCSDGRICDLLVPTDELEASDPTHYVRNGGAPSHWCVKPGPDSTPCGALREQGSRSRALYPGRCGHISQSDPQGGGEPILSDDPKRAVVIGAFATDVVRKTLDVPQDWTVDGDTPDVAGLKQRLFIPVRGDATLHWIDIDSDGMLECGQDGNDGACNDKHRSGDLSDEENTREDSRLAPEPFGLDADEMGVSLIVSNQTSGSVALFTHAHQFDESTGKTNLEWDAGPNYEFPETGLPTRPIGVANVPAPLAPSSSGRERPPGFLVTFRDTSTVMMVRVFDDAASNPPRPYTTRYESERISTNSSGIDSRGLTVDPFHRKANERRCLERFGVSLECARAPSSSGCDILSDEDLADFEECLQSAAATPLDVFIANRAPSSLILGRTEPILSDSVTTDMPSFYSHLPLDVGPSRTYIGDIINTEGERERRIFVVCFDSRRIAIYDPERRRLEAEVVTGRGPHGFALDVGTDHAYAYVGHFLDSYVGVVDLDQRHRGQYGALIATVGKPSEPRASK